MSTSKPVPDKDVSAYERWEAPVVDAESPITAAEAESIHKQAWEEGYAQGHAEGVKQGLQEGRAAGESEIRQRVALLEQVIRHLQSPLEQLDREVVDQVTELAVAVARHIVRRELHTDPGQVVAVVREAMAALPAGAQDVRIYLHPEDAVLVRQALSVEDDGDDGRRPWRIVDDPVLTRGDCRIQSEFSYIDATLERRLNRIIATLLGGEREADRDGDDGT